MIECVSIPLDTLPCLFDMVQTVLSFVVIWASGRVFIFDRPFDLIRYCFSFAAFDLEGKFGSAFILFLCFYFFMFLNMGIISIPIFRGIDSHSAVVNNNPRYNNA